MNLPSNSFFESLRGKTLLLVLITPWKTDRNDATKETTYLQSCYAPVVTDVQNLQGVVGLALAGKRWGIIDRIPATWKGIVEDDKSETEDIVDEVMYM